MTAADADRRTDFSRGPSSPGRAILSDGVTMAGDRAATVALRRLYDEGARAWPEISLPLDRFVAQMGSRSNAETAATELRAADLYLASACVQRIPAALDAFERTYMARVPSFLARRRPSPEMVDEVRQTMREKLFVSRDGGPGRIVEYDGKGALASWVRVVAVRTAIDLARQRGGAVETTESHADLPCPGLTRRDPEIGYIKRGYRRAFDEAFRTAVSRLDAEQRSLLHGHFVEGRTLDELAAELGVHRATIARRIAAGREAIAEEARRLLGDKLGATKAEIESIVALMRSRLEVSLAELLRAG
jgi:RNA polymerase sigma-70 factor (ECF subfamily)